MYLITYKDSFLGTAEDFMDVLGVVYEKFGTGYSIDLVSNVPETVLVISVRDQLTGITEFVSASSISFVAGVAEILYKNPELIKKKDISSS